MSSGDLQFFFRRLLIAVWAALTLILILAVIVLGYTLSHFVDNPLSIPADRIQRAAARRTEAVGATREVPLYFASADGRLLEKENRRMELSDFTIENCRSALEALVRGPSELLTPILPESVKVRALYMIEEGELVVDFSRELVLDHKKSASAEALMAYGIVNTVTERVFAGARGGTVLKVRFLVEGAPLGEAFGSHIDLSEPISPDPRWVATLESTEKASE